MAAIEEPLSTPLEKAQLLVLFAPEESISKSELCNDFTARRNQFQVVCERLHTLQTEWKIQMAKRRRHNAKLLDFEQCNGATVHVSQSGYHSFHGSDEDGKKATARIQITKTAVPLVWFDHRTIHFTPEGLEVQSGRGTIFRPNSAQSGPTITCQALANNSSAFQLIKLWEAMMGLSFLTLASSSVEGLQMLKGTDPGCQIPQSSEDFESHPMPPRKGDVLWLLHEFLDEHFPEGGPFCMAPASVFPESSDDLIKFKKFCAFRFEDELWANFGRFINSERHRNQQSVQQWNMLLQSSRTKVNTTLCRCLRRIRAVVAEKRIQTKAFLIQVSEKVYNGTAAGCSHWDRKLWSNMII